LHSCRALSSQPQQKEEFSKKITFAFDKPHTCLQAFLHFGSVPGGGGWYALKSGFGPMFTGLGTAVRFEKQGLKLRREFSRISNIPG
jgi:hypothetical protein